MRIILLLSAIVISFSSCSTNEIREPLEYNGPLREVHDFQMYHSEKDVVKVKMKAALLYEFKNQDQEFPKGIYIEFFDETGKIESTLRANHAYFFKQKNEWRGRGNVEVKNLQKNEQLNTEELFWKPVDKKIYTDKFVTIRQQEDILYGEGLDAKEDLSDYTITNLSGTFKVNE